MLGFEFQGTHAQAAKMPQLDAGVRMDCGEWLLYGGYTVSHGIDLTSPPPGS